jgi:predicted nucleic acid-binding protein
MTKIVIDSNIVFSALLNINSRIGQILINGSKYYEFYSPEYIRYEIIEHQEKIKRIGKLTDNEFIESYELIIRNLSILNHTIIPKKFYKTALELCNSVDVDDTAFVAITYYLKGKLWTGDKKLINGLKEKNYHRIITTEELYLDFIEREKKEQ